MSIKNLLQSIELEDEKLFSKESGQIKLLHEEYLRLTTQTQMHQQTTIIDLSFGQPAVEIINIKEIKPTIYMNSMINYLRAHFTYEYSYGMTKSLLLILDDLSDELRQIKYQKMGLVPNEFDDNNMVLLSNYHKETLINIVNFTNYDKVVILDRYRTLECVAKIKGEHFYLIDSESDIFDYNLNSDRCQIFATSTTHARYTVSPTFDALTINGQDRDVIAAECIPLIKRIVDG